MGYRQRERRRKRRAAMKGAQQEARASGSSAKKWWRTLVSRSTCCARCGRVLREGREMIYRHTPREALCLDCAERAKVRSRPSRRWEEARRHRRIA
jgi:hypothetical protein